MQNNTCKLCLLSCNDFAKSHIIPKWAFRSISNNLKSLTRNGYVKRAPMGVYDQNILCHCCEIKFGPFDSYAADVLRPLPYSDPESICRTSIEVPSPARLTIFFLSVLWRAHVSSMSEFAKVDLGIKHSQNIKEIILNPESFKAIDYPIILGQINWGQYGKGIIPPPMRREMRTLQGNLNGYTVWIGDFIAYLFIDSRMRSINSPTFTHNLAPTISLPQIDFSKTLEARALIDIMGTTKNHFQNI